MSRNLTEMVNRYINEQLLSIANIPQEPQIPSHEWVKKFTERLFLRRYRKYATTDAVRDDVMRRLQGIIDGALPMRFVPSFGGYKHWWAPTYPAADWAEVFNMKFLLELLAPLYQSYDLNKFIIEYESEEVVLHELNNVPQAGLDTYTKTFRALLKYFNSLTANKPEMKLTLAREQYEELGTDKSALLRRIEEMMPDCTARFDAYDEEDKKRRLLKAQTNFNLYGNPKEGTVDYSHFDDIERAALYRHSRIFNEAFLDADYEIRGNALFDHPEVVPMLFSFGLGPGGDAWLHIGSNSSSIVDFWAGIGILEIREDGKIIQRIISRSQFESIKDKLPKCKIETPISAIHKNFKEIYVYKGALVF